MLRFVQCAAALMAAAALCSCASPQTAGPQVEHGALAIEQDRQSRFTLERRAADYKRVYDIADRLSRANQEFCPRTTPDLGLRLETLNDHRRDLREAARTLWGLGDAPRIQWIGANSPAQAADLRVGDEIVAINGRPIPPRRRTSRPTHEDLREAAADGAVTLEISRGGEALTIQAAPRTACAYEVFMIDDPELNASANGDVILINRGMLRFAESDEELALILGHELAHNAMRHIESMRQNAMIGAIGGAMLDILAAAGGVNTGGAFTDAGGDIGAMMFSQAFESEADYVGMYFMARAGYGVDGVEAFWRRMAAEHPQGIRLAYTHPTTAERFLRLESTGQEIATKRAGGEDLRPNMRPD